ncbi:hypothetical protein AB1E18_019145 [Capra hircus]
MHVLPEGRKRTENQTRSDPSSGTKAQGLCSPREGCQNVTLSAQTLQAPGNRLQTGVLAPPGGVQGKHRGSPPCLPQPDRPNRKIPHALEQLSPCATAIEPVLWSLGTEITEARALEPRLRGERNRRSEKPVHRNWKVAPARCNERKPEQQQPKPTK